MLDPLEQFPDSVFVEDPALVFGEGAILLNPGAAARSGEGRHLLPALERNFPQVLHLERGHADGGDAMVTPDMVLIGLSARTTAPGPRAWRARSDSSAARPKIVRPPAGCAPPQDDRQPDRRGDRPHHRRGRGERPVRALPPDRRRFRRGGRGQCAARQRDAAAVGEFPAHRRAARPRGPCADAARHDAHQPHRCRPVVHVAALAGGGGLSPPLAVPSPRTTALTLAALILPLPALARARGVGRGRQVTARNRP